MTQIDDPHAQREAQKYENPIPSREFIMDHLRERSGPATLNQVSFELALFEAEDVEALRRRLRAMERDGWSACVACLAMFVQGCGLH